MARRAKREWSAELELQTESGASLGQRTLSTTATHCSSLDDSLALVVALLVDAPSRAPERSDEPLISDAAAATPEPKEPLAVRRARAEATPIQLPPSTLAPREPWRFEATASASLALGLLPGSAFGVELGLSGKAPRAPDLRVFAGAYASRDALAGPGAAGARFGFLFVGLEICPLEGSVGRLRWSTCAGQSVGRLHAAAFGYDQSLSTDRLVYALLGRGALVLAVSGPLSVRMTARAELPLARPVFFYGSRDNMERNVFEMSPVVAVFDAGLSIAL
jgi:hypothetical protein